jgi:hypothetical protein
MEKEKINECGKLSGCEMLECLGHPHPCWMNKTTQSQATPSLATKIWNFSSAMVRWGASGFPVRSQQEIEKLLSICQSCEFFVENHCSQCGCACNEQNQVMNKLVIATEKCPQGKW